MKIGSMAMLSLFLMSIASMGLIQSADAAGAIEGEFVLGEVLDESVGWFIVVGLGMVFAGIISAEIKIEEKYLGHVQNSEWFNCGCNRVSMDLGCHTASILNCSVSLWCKWSFLVCSRSINSGTFVRNSSH